jgi:hypothetical protein
LQSHTALLEFRKRSNHVTGPPIDSPARIHDQVNDETKAQRVARAKCHAVFSGQTG